MKTSSNPTDESTSLSFTSFLTVLRSNSWRPPWGMGKYLRGRLNWCPFCRRLTVLLSLDRSVVTRSFCRHSAQIILSQSLDSISHGHFRLRSLAVDHFRSFCRHSAVTFDFDLVVTRLALLRSLDALFVVTRHG
ncbi:hypothetical protein Bca52824_065122 [Brassica carinata]|uniref:Uncharacterized protein n=1 Tax=Brassica carinata TaxID=52824 RepID=A0A8X7QJQ9_BRACI|nr:hypothetical protein Bca52824_065122 [Brassica carinata]